jgi:hypothetical protein
MGYMHRSCCDVTTRAVRCYNVTWELISCSCRALPIYSSVTCQEHGEGVWLSGAQLVQRQDGVEVHSVAGGDEVVQHTVTVARDVCLYASNS